MPKDLLNTTKVSDNIAGVPRKQKFVTNPTPSAVTRYVCISKDAHGSSHSQPLAFWESVRKNDPVVTQHVCSFEESESDVSSSVASTNVVLKKHVAVIPADAVPAFAGFCSAEGLNQKRHRQRENVTHIQRPAAHIKSCREQQKSTRITPHTWREQIEIIKREDAIAAEGGTDTTVTVSAVKLKGLSVNTKSVTSETKAQNTFTQLTSADNPGDTISEENIITSEKNAKEFHESVLGDLGVNDPEVCSKPVICEPEVLSGNGNNVRTEKLATNIEVKSVCSTQKTSTQARELKSSSFEKKSTSDIPKRKLFHNRNKTREYILQQKQKRKERFAVEQSKKNMEDEMKKVKLQTLREKSLRIVKTNVKKSLSKKRSPEKIKNLGPDITSTRDGKVDDLQTPAVTINTKSVSQKSVTVTKYKVTESISSRVPQSAKCGNDNIDVPQNSSLHDSNAANSNKSSSLDLEFKENQQIRNELDLKIRAVAKALSAELESNILHSSYDLSDKMTDDSNNLSLQRPLLRLRDTVCNRQPVAHNMENSRAVNIDSAVINISDSPPTKLKRYDHTKQMKSLEKKMEIANHTISMLRENNIIKSVEQSSREQTGIFKGPEKVLKENSIELDKKSRQKTVQSPQQYFSKRSAFPLHHERYSDTTENSRKLLKKRRIADKKNIQNNSITSSRTVLSHVPQMSMEYSSATSEQISEYGLIEKGGNVQPQARKRVDEVVNFNYLPSTFSDNLQTVESNICVNPMEQKKDPETSYRLVKNRQTAHGGSNKMSDTKSQVQTDAVTTDKDSVKACEFKVQPNEKLKKLLMQQVHQNDQHVVNPLISDVTTRSPGATAELFKRAVEREKRERAATRIQALYRGHSTRKITDPLLTSTKSKGDVHRIQLQGEECNDSTKKETRYKENLCGGKLETGERTDWLELEPVKPCPYNVMTAVRQKLLALKKVSDAKVETKSANICVDQTLADDKSSIKLGNNTRIPDQNEVCTSGLWVEENATVQQNSVSSATEQRKKVHSVRLHSAKEYSSGNVEGKLDNRKTSGSNKSYVFSEEADWIENEGPKKKGIGSSHLSEINKTNITQQSRNKSKTCESSVKSSVVGSDTEHSLTHSLKNNSECLALPDVHLVRKRRRSENGTISIPSNSKESCLSGVKESENSLPTSMADWIEASVHLSSAQTSFPSEASNRTKNNESETHYKESVTEAKSDHEAKNSDYSKKTISGINISDTGHAEKSSSQSTGIPLETETKKTVSGSSANGNHNRHKFHNVLESRKMMPPEALHLQFQAEINLLESLEESRLRLAQIEGLHALSLVQHQHRPIATGQKESKTQVRCEKQEKELLQTEKSVLKNSEMNCLGENKEMQNVKYSYDSSFTSVSEDISGQTSSTKSKHSKSNSIRDSTVTKTLDAALKKGQISIEAYCKYEKLIQEEATRAREQAALLDTTEQALVDRFKTDMKSLEANRRQLKQSGKENLIPSVKKRQRALILKLDHDREEMKRLRNTYMEASKEWKNLLLQHLNLAKCKVLDNGVLGKMQQERALTTTTTTCISAELGNRMNSGTQKSVVPSTSPWQAEVSSSIQTELSQHSAQSTRSAGSGSWSPNQKTENSATVQNSVDVCTDVTITETAAQTNSAESRHSLLPSKRLWSHDEISDWQQSPGEDKRRVRPFRYHRDHSVSPMRALNTEKQHINLSGSADSVPAENNSAGTCFDRDSICGKNSSSGRTVPVIRSNNKNSSASQKTAAIVPSAEVLCKRSDASIRMPISPQSWMMKRQSSGSDESIMLSQGDTPSEQSDLEGRVSALREQLRRRELEAEKLKHLQRRKAHREKLKATEQSLLKQIQVLDSYITRTKEELKQDFSISPLPAVKPKIKQPRVRTDQSSKHVLDKSKEKSQPHHWAEGTSKEVLNKTEYESPLDDTSQKSILNDVSTEIPTMILSEQTASSVTFLPEDTNSITFRELHTSEDGNRHDEILSVSDSYERRAEAPGSTEDYISTEKNSYSENKKTTLKTSSIKKISSLSSDQQSSIHVKHTNNFQVLDSYITQTKEELMEGFNTSPLPAVKPKVKQTHIQSEQSSKRFVDKRKEKSQPHEQTEQNSNHMLDKAVYKSPPDDTSQYGIRTEIPNVMLSEQTPNSVTFLSEDANSITSREAHTSYDQEEIVSVSGCCERTEVPDSAEDYISTEKNSYSKNKNATIKISSIKEITSLNSEHSKSDQSFSSSVWSGGESIIPTMFESGDHFVEEDREISEVLIDSTFVVDKAEFSLTEQCKDSKNDYAQESCFSSSLKPLNNSSEDNSNNLLSERPDSSVKNFIALGTDSKSCTSTTINEELPEIEETSMSVQQISDFAEKEKASSVDSIQHEISIKPESEIENVVNITDIVSAPQNVNDDVNILTSDTEMKNTSPDILAAGREEIMDNMQEVVLSTDNQSQLLEKEISEDSVLIMCSDSAVHSRDMTKFCHSSDDSTCTESHPAPVQLSSTFVVERGEHTPLDQTVEEPTTPVASEENENRMQKLKLVDSITESIMLQLLKDSFALPASKLKECGEVPNGKAPRKTILSEAQEYSENTKPDIDLVRESQLDSRSVVLDEAEKQENLAIEQKPNTVDDICISNTTFLLDESSKAEKNTSVLVDEMLNCFLENATSDVLNIYNTKMSNSDRLCAPSDASKESTQSPSIEIPESGDDSDLRLPGHNLICKPSEIINITLKNNNTHLSVNDMISNDVLNDSFQNSKKINVIESGMEDMISFTSPDSKRVQEPELPVKDVLKSVSEHSVCDKLMNRTDGEQPHETEKDDVSSGSLITDEDDSQLHHRLTTAGEMVMSEEPLPNGSKSQVATQNGNKLKDVSHLQKVEVRGKQTLNNETFPPGWFDEDLDLSNSWREAEQLRLQQLHIEQEIRRLEEQQHQQQALVLVREIPDKPPPPYTPRGTTLQSSSPLYPPPAIGASAPRHRLVELVAEATPLLTCTTTPPMLPPEDFCTGYNLSIRRFIFDLSRSLVNEAVSVPGTDDEWGEETPPQQMTVKRSQEAVRTHVTRRATALLDGSASAGAGTAGKLRRLAVGPRWRRRDHVDELLVREARDEEPGWIDYRRDEAHLCNETACTLLRDLLDDTATAITTAIMRRMAPRQQV